MQNKKENFHTLMDYRFDLIFQINKFNWTKNISNQFLFHQNKFKSWIINKSYHNRNSNLNTKETLYLVLEVEFINLVAGILISNALIVAFDRFNFGFHIIQK